MGLPQTTIRALLNRIQWDSKFGKGRFDIAWYDRIADDIVRSPLPRARRQNVGTFGIDVADDQTGESVAIPYHRVRQVYRNGKLIWTRKTKPR